MSGYLAHLVARMAPGGTRPGVRPRPVSRFEPAAPAGLLPWLGTDEQAADGGETPPMHRPDREPVEREPGRAAPAPPAVDAPSRRPRMGDRSRPPLARDRPMPEPERREHAGPPARPGYLVPHAAPQAEPVARRPEPRRTPDPSPAGGMSTEQGEAPEAAASTPQPGTARPAQAVAAVGRPPVVVASIRPLPPEPARPQAPLPGGHPPAREAKPSPADPAVHITIGRVEVIATPPAHPAPRASVQPARPSGVMSLDEYLNSREEEGRP